MSESTTLEKPAKNYLGHAPIDCDVHPSVPDTRVCCLISMTTGARTSPSTASTDYPHWRFDGTEAMPKAMTPLAKKILVDNPRETYARLA